MTTAPAQQAPVVLSVFDLTQQIKDLLERGFRSVWVCGEISNLSQPRSGHCYFTLKDEQAQLGAVAWRNTAARIPFELHDGMEVIVCGDLNVYPPHGKYQLVVRQIEPKGLGALELALRRLREKLAREGLFDPDRKRPLPRFPRRIAFVTSPTGAAIRDFLEVLRRRWSGVDVLVIPARVQGEGAAQEIAAGIELANQLGDSIDCLVVGRGGGSMEDLWCFNEEIVVRAIYHSRIPVVSAVGHEIDVTLSDLAADVRALTPSEAAERVAPSRDEILGLLGDRQRRLVSSLFHRAQAARARLDLLADRRVLRRPHDRVLELMQRLDELSTRMNRAVARRTERLGERLEATKSRLQGLSPLAVLARGYTVTTRADGAPLLTAEGLQAGETLITRFAQGSAASRVETVDLPRADGAVER